MIYNLKKANKKIVILGELISNVNVLSLTLIFAMILSFTTTPIFAFLNYKLVRSTKLPKELQNGIFLNILSICGLIFLFGFLILFIIYRWFPFLIGL